MAIRYYLIDLAAPQEGAAIEPVRLAAAGVNAYVVQGYGREPVGLVQADVTGAQHSALAAFSDVVVVPSNLSSAITAAQLAAVRAALEAKNIPQEVAVQGMTYSVLLRWVFRLCFFAQKLWRRHKRRVFPSGVTLSTLVSDLPSGLRSALEETSEFLGLDTSAVTGSMTYRQALKATLDQIRIPARIGSQDF